MADLLEQASAWLQNQLKRHASRMVIYERGVDTVDVQATIGRTVFQIDNGYGVLERTETRDYLITAADLVLVGSTTVPQRGDRIRETQGGTTYVYEVMAPGKEPAWRYSDAYRRTLRIHTKQIDTEEAP